MISTRRKRWTFAMAVVVTAGSLAALHAQQASQSANRELQRLAEQRIAAAQETYELLLAPPRNGTFKYPDLETVYLWSRRWLDAELDAAPTAAGHRDAYRRHLERMKEPTDRYLKQEPNFPVPVFRKAAAEALRAEAEFWNARAQSN